MLAEIGADEVPVELVLNKIDQVDPLTRRRLANRFPARRRSPPRRGRGSTSCASASPSASPTASRTSACCSRTSDGAKLAELYALGTPIDERRETEEGVYVRARLRRKDAPLRAAT